MIRNLVTVNETVTDFCCVLNFMDMRGSKQCFEILHGHSYSSLQTQNAANGDWVEEKGYRTCQELDKKDN